VVPLDGAAEVSLLPYLFFVDARACVSSSLTRSVLTDSTLCSCKFKIVFIFFCIFGSALIRRLSLLSTAIICFWVILVSIGFKCCSEASEHISVQFEDISDCLYSKIDFVVDSRAGLSSQLSSIALTVAVFCACMLENFTSSLLTL